MYGHGLLALYDVKRRRRLELTVSCQWHVLSDGQFGTL
jgi:hypothetical protein